MLYDLVKFCSDEKLTPSLGNFAPKHISHSSEANSDFDIDVSTAKEIVLLTVVIVVNKRSSRDSKGM